MNLVDTGCDKTIGFLVSRTLPPYKDGYLNWMINKEINPMIHICIMQ